MFKPELLSPAGTLRSMRYAFAYGADAIYAGQPRYSLRVRNNEFNKENLQIGINEAHEIGKKFYVVLNIIPHNAKIKTFIQDLKPIIEASPDALIISDPGLIMLVREYFPEVSIHLSVQSNTVNWATVKFWQKIGLTRIILSRELSLEEIEEICQKVPEMEIEVFIHGALCMAYSGRCLISSYINKRDPNQGACKNSCRLKYNIQEGKEDEVGNIICKYELNSGENANSRTNINKSIDQIFLLKEKKYSLECMTAFEDNHGTYIMNSKDLCAVQHVAHLAKIGVHSLKIEGRTKSLYYCARTAQVYRKAIDDAVTGKEFDPSLLEMLEKLAHRGYTEGFLRRHNHSDYQNYELGYSTSKYQRFVGVCTGERKGILASVIVKNKFSVGDNLELMSPQGNIDFTLEYIENLKGKKTLVAKGDDHIVWIPLPKEIHTQYALLIRDYHAYSTSNKI